MKPENNFSRAFIDLAGMGRTDWRSVALTLLLLKLLAILFALLVVVPPDFVEHPFFHLPAADKTLLLQVVDAVACVSGFWLACKKILRRPFRSLISTDITFDIRRCLLGAALYLPANALSLVAMALYMSMRAGAWRLPFPHFEWPHDSGQIVASVGLLIFIPLLAFAEELYFRGWLTQTLRRYMRFPGVVVALVAVLFAATHTQYDLRMKTLILLNSLGLSALSLRDQRLELAIGAHSMMNVCATLLSLFFTGHVSHTPLPVITFDGWTLLILKGVLPYVLMYKVLQKTAGWFVPADTRLTSAESVGARQIDA